MYAAVHMYIGLCPGGMVMPRTEGGLKRMNESLKNTNDHIQHVLRQSSSQSSIPFSARCAAAVAHFKVRLGSEEMPPSTLSKLQ